MWYNAPTIPLLFHLVGLYYCTSDARSYRHEIYGETRFVFHPRAVSRLPLYFFTKNELFYADENFLVESEKPGGFV